MVFDKKIGENPLEMQRIFALAPNNVKMLSL